MNEVYDCGVWLILYGALEWSVLMYAESGLSDAGICEREDQMRFFVEGQGSVDGRIGNIEWAQRDIMSDLSL